MLARWFLYTSRLGINQLAAAQHSCEALRRNMAEWSAGCSCAVARARAGRPCTERLNPTHPCMHNKRVSFVSSSGSRHECTFCSRQHQLWADLCSTNLDVHSHTGLPPSQTTPPFRSATKLFASVAVAPPTWPGFGLRRTAERAGSQNSCVAVIQAANGWTEY